MALLKEVERSEKRDSLIQFKNQARAAIDVLIGIKSNILALKTVVTNDTDNFDATDVTDVQTIVDYINTEIGKI
jgi:hypothetical protein